MKTNKVAIYNFARLNLAPVLKLRAAAERRVQRRQVSFASTPRSINRRLQHGCDEALAWTYLRAKVNKGCADRNEPHRKRGK